MSARLVLTIVPEGALAIWGNANALMVFKERTVQKVSRFC